MRRACVLLLGLALVAALLPSAGSAAMRKWPDSGFSLIFEDGTALEFGIASGLDLETAFGVGFPPVDNITTPYAILDGSVYQRSITRNRTITLVIRANGKSQYGLQVLRSRIIKAVNPHRTTLPVRLQYQGASRVLYIEGYYAGGLELPGEVRTGFERIALQLLCNDPYWRDLSADGGALVVRQSIANMNRIGQRAVNGAWSNMVNGADGDVFCAAYDRNGILYVGGAFHNIGGGAALHIARWTGTAWQAVGAGLDDVVYALAVDANNVIYAVGSFHNVAGGGIAVAHIAKYTIATGVWAVLGAGLDNLGLSVAVDSSGTVYAGGDFHNAGGGAALHIAKWTGAAWSALGAGLSASCSFLLPRLGGGVWAAGLFATVAGPGITLNYVGAWNGTAWSALGTGLNNFAYALALGPGGELYAGGAFTTAGGVAALRVARWNGASWSALGQGFANAEILWLSVDSNGTLYAGGSATATGAVSLPMSWAWWRSPIWVPGDGNIVAGTTYVILARNGVVTAAGSYAGALAYPGYQTITNAGSANAYPIFTFVGPGRLFQLVNYTTGKRIDFNLTLLAGETVTLDLHPGYKTLTSNFRGNLASAILPGDLTTWCLAPGANYVAVWIDDVTATGTISYVPRYWSIDGATD